jgi:tRNA1Val (adenine37-N6)-methyltransferase
MPMGETTLDSIASLSIRQPLRGYRFSMEPVLLSSFVSLKSPRMIADFGAGSGVMGLLLARRFQKARVTLVEMQKALFDLCLRNIEENDLSGRVEAIRIDIRKIRSELSGLDVVVSNPPFRRPGTGRISRGGGGQRASARHEGDLPLDELCASAARVLRGRGRFYLVHLPERLVELIDSLRAARLEPKRLRFIHGRQGLEAKMILMEAVRDGSQGMIVEAPLYIYKEGSDDYTEEVTAMYRV